MTAHRRRILFVVALAAALSLPAVPAGAHEHPTPTERAAPGVVYVEARAKVEVALVEHLLSDPGGIHIRIIQSTSTPVLATASGFVVESTGTIVTTGAITQNDLDRARVYAINEAFVKRYGDQAPLGGDLFTEQRVGDPASRLQQRLEACYPPHRTNDAGGCVVTVEPTYVVYPHVTSQEEYGQLPAELLQSSTPDVAVLRVRGASGMPTVPLGESTAGAYMLAGLGFTGVPNGADPPRSVNAHLAEPGGTRLKTENLDEKEYKANVDMAAALPAGMLGGPLVAEQGQVVGFLVPDADSGPPPAAPGRLVDAGAIRGVLSAEGITPRQGPVDTSYEAAMHAFKNGGFAASIPSLRATLDLFPGHALAAANLAVAEQNVAAGTPGPAPPAPPADSAGTGSATSFPWAVVLLVLLLLAVVAVLVLRRRRHASAPGSGTPLPGMPRPRAGAAGYGEGQTDPSDPSGTGRRERQAAPSVASGSGSGTGTGSVVVVESDESRPGAAPSTNRGEPTPSGSAPSRPVTRHGQAGAGGDGSHRASRAFAEPTPVPSTRRGAASQPTAEDRPTFCTSCGVRLAPQHRYCGRCGQPAG
ncbi:trypsin-like peptidase domain-containing protein [Geodermatophilus sp. URMC 65]